MLGYLVLAEKQSVSATLIPRWLVQAQLHLGFFLSWIRPSEIECINCDDTCRRHPRYVDIGFIILRFPKNPE